MTDADAQTRTDEAVAYLRGLIDRIPDSTHATCDKTYLRTVLDALADRQERVAEIEEHLRTAAHGLQAYVDANGHNAARVAELEAELAEREDDVPSRITAEMERDDAQAERDVALAQLAEARGQVADYENRITWNTTCGRCSRTLDAAYEQTVRAEKAEAERDEARRQLAALRTEEAVAFYDDEADTWRPSEFRTVAEAIAEEGGQLQWREATRLVGDWTLVATDPPAAAATPANAEQFDWRWWRKPEPDGAGGWMACNACGTGTVVFETLEGDRMRCLNCGETGLAGPPTPAATDTTATRGQQATHETPGDAETGGTP